MAINLADAAKTAGCTGAVTGILGLINSGGVGFMRIFNSAATALVNIPLSASAFGAAAVSGTTGIASCVVATASGTATAGTASYFAFFNTATATIFWGTCQTATSDLNLDSLQFVSGDTVKVAGFTFRVTA